MTVELNVSIPSPPSLRVSSGVVGSISGEGAITNEQIDEVVADDNPEGTESLRLTGLSYFWSKLKAAFALASHDHTAIGYDSNHNPAIRVDTTKNSIAEGGFGATASGGGSHAEGGAGATASGYYSHAEGTGTQASGMASHAEGSGSKAQYSNAHAEGSGTTASGSSSHAEGSATKATGNSSHAEGFATESTSDQTHAEGAYCKATSARAHAEGNYTVASNDCAHAEGYYTTASGAYSHAEGRDTLADGAYSHAEGRGTQAFTDAAHVFGKWNTGSVIHIGDEWVAMAEVVGNGTDADNRSNARYLDFDGNEWLAGGLTFHDQNGNEHTIDSILQRLSALEG